MHALNEISVNWSGNLAYVIGLITTDGNLSSDGRHITFVSKDLQLIKTFQKCLGINKKIRLKKSGFAPEKKYYYIQFGDIRFYNFLSSIGLTPAKSKTLGVLKIPNKHFFDFLRGHFDGDGSCYSYWDKRWNSSFMFYTTFVSSSKKHALWLRSRIKNLLKIKGNFNTNSRDLVCQLKYAKKESKKLVSKMYYSNNLPCLKRKYIKLIRILKIDKKEAEKI